tara:strand:+ start:558 stop:752 length:195 start_codon:yes stop_codon:yes gene_type:complete
MYKIVIKNMCDIKIGQDIIVKFTQNISLLGYHLYEYPNSYSFVHANLRKCVGQFDMIFDKSTLV